MIVFKYISLLSLGPFGRIGPGTRFEIYRATHDDILSTLQHQHASYNKEYSYALLYNLYHCDYMVNGSFSVNILHCSFAKWLRSQREETVVQC